MEKEIRKLYDSYTNGKTSRRHFLKKVALYTGSTMLAASLIPILQKGDLMASIPSSGDTDLTTGFVNYKGMTGEVKAFMAHPAAKSKYPAVVVIHENRGLQPHIIDVTKRLAMAGFLAMAPDGLSPLGGTPEDQDEARTLIGKLDIKTTTGDFAAAVKYLQTNPFSNGNVGCTGFSWGGAMTNRVAVECSELKAAVPYYGTTPSGEDVPKIKAAIMAHYAGTDEWINGGIPAFEEALKKNSKEYSIFIYDGTQHGFNNDTGTRYNKEAADLAWERSVKFLKEKLKS